MAKGEDLRAKKKRQQRRQQVCKSYQPDNDRQRCHYAGVRDGRVVCLRQAGPQRCPLAEGK